MLCTKGIGCTILGLHSMTQAKCGLMDNLRLAWGAQTSDPNLGQHSRKCAKCTIKPILPNWTSKGEWSLIDQKLCPPWFIIIVLYINGTLAVRISCWNGLIKVCKMKFVPFAWLLLGTLLPAFLVERKVFIKCQIYHNGPPLNQHTCECTEYCVGKYRDNPQIGYTKLRSKVCTGQSADCPDPNFTGNIYSYATNEIMWQMLLHIVN